MTDPLNPCPSCGHYLTAIKDNIEALTDDRDRARTIAVALEQENAQLTADYAEAVDEIAGILPQVRELEAEYERARQVATTAGAILEQVGLLHEAWHEEGTLYALALGDVLNGATFEEVAGG